MSTTFEVPTGSHVQVKVNGNDYQEFEPTMSAFDVIMEAAKSNGISKAEVWLSDGSRLTAEAARAQTLGETGPLNVTAKDQVA